MCLSSRGPNSEALLRYASAARGTPQPQLVRRLRADAFRRAYRHGRAGTQHKLSGTLTLAKQLGAMVFTYKGEDVVQTILQFAKEYRVGHIVIGQPRRPAMVEAISRQTHGRRTPHPQSPGIQRRRPRHGQIRQAIQRRLHADPDARLDTAEACSARRAAPLEQAALGSSYRHLGATRGTRNEVIRKLVEVAVAELGMGNYPEVLDAVLKREDQGSTFFNDGVAFPTRGSKTSKLRCSRWASRGSVYPT